MAVGHVYTRAGWVVARPRYGARLDVGAREAAARTRRAGKKASYVQESVRLTSPDETSPKKTPRHALRLEATTLFRARAPLARALARRWGDASGVTMVGRRRTAKCVARARMAR